MSEQVDAIVAHGPRDLRIETCDVPDPGPGEVLIRMAVGGICGSDLHYYQHGGFGKVRIREPMILGHEVAGHVARFGPGVTGLEPGALVALSPSRPCWRCDYCHDGRPNHCLNMRFYGSAMPFPHIQGAFRRMIVADATQCVPADALSAAEAAMAEPLAVCLHAARQAGDLMGQRVLITGCGPIGLLMVLVCHAAGATEIVTTDITDFTLEIAARLGADRALNVVSDPDALQPYTANKGHFDVHFECSGVAAAFASAVPALRPGGTVVQLGLGGDMTVPMQAMTAKEIILRGSFRFHTEFATAVQLMQRGQVDVKPLITHTFPLTEALTAFQQAGDRSQAIKAQITFS